MKQAKQSKPMYFLDLTVENVQAYKALMVSIGDLGWYNAGWAR